jgi:nicotinate-nucleotide adenylyltransferase
MRKIGILGGSFDPIHFGHLLMAQSAAEALKLDRVFFVPAFRSPFKADHSLPPSAKRLDMVKLAIKGNKIFSVYDGELQRGGVSYTVDTLKEFKIKYPQAKFYLLMGADSLRQFHRWKQPKEILNLAELVILNRPGFDKNYSKRWPSIKVNMPAVDISSSDIRHRLKEKKSIWYLTFTRVIRYINSHHLYGV